MQDLLTPIPTEESVSAAPQPEQVPPPPPAPEPPPVLRPAPRPRRWVGAAAALALILSMAATALSGLTLWLVWPEDGSFPGEEGPEQQPGQEEVHPGDFIQYRDRQLEILEGVAVNQYDRDAFTTASNGWLQYRSGGVEALQGVDVSAHQKEIDWQQVAASGIDFAMIRVGYRGYGTEGIIKEDEYARANLEGAVAAGLEVGVYFFSQATTVWEAMEEAEFVLEIIKDYDVTWPVVFDWEFVSSSQAPRTEGMSGRQLTLMAGAFCERVEQAGHTPAIYFNQDTGYLFLELDVLSDWPFWLAAYNAKPGFFYHFDMWQYTDKGNVPGISRTVDLNLAFRDMGAD